jgi:hypothetical protein
MQNTCSYSIPAWSQNLASFRVELLELELEKPDLQLPSPPPLRALPGQRDKGRFTARQTTHELLDGVAPSPGHLFKLAFTVAAKRSRVLGNHTQRPDFKGDDETICSGLRLVPASRPLVLPAPSGKSPERAGKVEAAGIEPAFVGHPETLQMEGLWERWVSPELPRNIKLGQIRRTVGLLSPEEWRDLDQGGAKPSTRLACTSGFAAGRRKHPAFEGDDCVFLTVRWMQRLLRTLGARKTGRRQLPPRFPSSSSAD